jgi:hypothetical protein
MENEELEMPSAEFMEKLQELGVKLSSICLPYGPRVSMAAMTSLIVTTIEFCIDDKMAMYKALTRQFLDCYKAHRESKEENNDDQD